MGPTMISQPEKMANYGGQVMGGRSVGIPLLDLEVTPYFRETVGQFFTISGFQVNFAINSKKAM